MASLLAYTAQSAKVLGYESANNVVKPTEKHVASCEKFVKMLNDIHS